MGKTQKGKTGFTLEKNGAFFIYKDVEADVAITVVKLTSQ